MFTKESLRRNAIPLLLGIGSLFIMLILGLGALTVALSNANQPSAPMAAQSQGQEYTQDQGYTQSRGNSHEEGQTSESGASGPVASGYVAPGPTAPGYSAPDAGSAAVTDGYWERQRSQDQQAQAFDGYINDTNTVRDTQTGQTYSNVSNSVADPAIESGAATQVPTSELPTSSDTGSTAAAE